MALKATDAWEDPGPSHFLGLRGGKIPGITNCSSGGTVLEMLLVGIGTTGRGGNIQEST